MKYYLPNTQHQHVVQTRFERDRTNDIGGDQDFQTQQQRRTQPGFVNLVRRAEMSLQQAVV